ncbi:hypothetical protein [Streptomyces sp. SID3343]|uniref:hypothetical protein n=1 Tax=Streptomyces sp. SID3343 TaxID=2690260 RepID=UPI00136E9542|nr:hypothetical protein [Streptomyces sp. SID3343]MYW04347.1 hypothetical protein [Streptomyces sp. SID3343]
MSGTIGTGPARRPSAPAPTGDFAPSGATREKRIALWGAPKSGRTTFLGVLDQASEENCRTVEQVGSQGHRAPGWKVLGEDQATLDFLTEARRRTTGRQGLFPERRKGLVRYRYLFRRRPRFEPWARISDRSRFVATVVDLPDLAAEHPAQVRTEFDACTGLIYLFDPVPEAAEQLAEDLAAFEKVLKEAARQQQYKMSADQLLPQELAICVTKIDDSGLFLAARRAGRVELDKGGRIRVPDPEGFFRWATDSTERPVNPAAGRLAKLLTDTFDPARTRFYATSAAGFRAFPGHRVDPERCRNVGPRPARIEGRPRPQGIIEPILAMRSVPTAETTNPPKTTKG